MIGSVASVVLDTRDPRGLATFYQQLLGGELSEESGADDDWVELDCGMAATKLAFQLSPHHSPPTFPDEYGSQQFHLDVLVESLDTGEADVLRIGGRKVAGQDHDHFRVFLDPAGHPFCLIDET